MHFRSHAAVVTHCATQGIAVLILPVYLSFICNAQGTRLLVLDARLSAKAQAIAAGRLLTDGRVRNNKQRHPR